MPYDIIIRNDKIQFNDKLISALHIDIVTEGSSCVQGHSQFDNYIKLYSEIIIYFIEKKKSLTINNTTRNNIITRSN